jgi:hypothetical protein
VAVSVKIWKEGRESQLAPGKMVTIQDLFPRFPCMHSYDVRRCLGTGLSS